MRTSALQLGLLSKDKKRQVVNEIVAYFKEERGEEIGVIRAEEILDFFLDSVGKDIYNKGVRDAKILLRQRLEDFDIDLESLIVE